MLWFVFCSMSCKEKPETIFTLSGLKGVTLHTSQPESNGNNIVLHVFLTMADISYRFDRAEIVTRLLERGADPFIESDNHLTPLHSAARRGLTEICRLLLRDPRLKQTAVKSKIVSPFHLACFSGNRETCELFLANGADVVMKSASHYTPLHFTAWLGNENICEFLIETGNSLFS